MRRFGVLIAGLLLIAGVIAFVLSRAEEEPEHTVLPPLAVAAPRVVGTWTPSTPNEVELVVSVTEHGQPASGAEVRVEGKEPALTDARGLATFRLPSGAVQLTATAHGVTVRGAATLSPLLGSSRVALSLDARGTFEVSVIDRKTKLPITGALVELHLSPEHPRRVIAVMQTDAGGKAKAEGLAPMEYLLSVSHAGYIEQLCVIARVGESREVTLMPREARSGRVLLPDGKPAAGATVVSVTTGWESAATATTGADGTFTLPFVNNRGLLCAQLGELVAGETAEVASTTGMTLGPAPRFGGSVADEDGAPLEGVHVRLQGGGLEALALTGADGRFTLQGLCHSFTYATFEREGFVTEGEILSLEEDVAVTLSRPSAVRGVVVDDESQPVAGAVVKLDEPVQLTVTDAEGRFGFEGVKREVSVCASEGRRSGCGEATVERGQLVEVTISVGPPLFNVPVEIVRGGELAFGVWDLSAQRLDGRAWETNTHWHARGRVLDVVYGTSLRLPVGSFKVKAENEEGHGETEFRVTGQSPQAPLRIHVVDNPPPPRAPTRQLRVRVLDARGAPTQDAGVHCMASEWGYALTGPDGRGVCEMLETSSLPIALKTRVGGAFANGQLTDWNEEVVLQLKDSMTIRGRVIGEVPAGASINVNSKEESSSFPITPPEFVLSDRPAVRSIVCVWAESAERGCAVAQPVEGGELQVTIPVGARGQVSFTVSDARGQAVAEPVLYVDRHSSRPPIDGGVVMLDLSPGQHLLIVNVEGGPERYETVLSVEPGRARHLGRIELK